VKKTTFSMESKMFEVGKKNVRGRNSIITLVATQDDGAKIAAYMKEKHPENEYVVSEKSTVIIDTPETFIARFEAEKTAESRKASALADMLLVASKRREMGEATLSEEEIKAIFAGK
jgi:hypothetical protein